MSRKKRNNKSGSRSHTTKTRREQDAYSQKIKLAESEGDTNQPPRDLSSTHALPSRFTHGQNAGIPDRCPIAPPQSQHRLGWLKLIGILGGIPTLVGMIFWFATLKNRIDYNEKQISTLNDSMSTIDSKREDMATRITRLEFWKESFSTDLEKLKQDMQNGVSSDQIELMLINLEKRISETQEPSQSD